MQDWDALRKLIYDIRVDTTISSLSPEEIIYLERLPRKGPSTAWGVKEINFGGVIQGLVMKGLFEKGVVRTVAKFEDGKPAYKFTRLGWEVAQRLKYMPLNLKYDYEAETDQ